MNRLLRFLRLVVSHPVTMVLVAGPVVLYVTMRYVSSLEHKGVAQALVPWFLIGVASVLLYLVYCIVSSIFRGLRDLWKESGE